MAASLYNRIFSSPITFLILLGLLIRIAFTILVAPLMYSHENIFFNSDTLAWMSALDNLLQYGTFSTNMSNQMGMVGRMPGYSIFLLPFYVLSGFNWSVALPITGYSQILLDCISIWLMYRITLVIFSKKIAVLAGFIYACYPFIIFWNPIAYSESVSVFFMLLGLFFVVKKVDVRNLFIASIILGLGALVRPQLLFLYPALIGFIFFQKYSFKLFTKYILFICFGFIISYSWWPIRNYIQLEKIIITQDLRSFPNWNEDVIAYMQYIYSVKSNWEPQFSQIIKNQNVDYPFLTPVSKNDSVLFRHAVHLSQTCGSGFSHWKGYWAAPIKKTNCNAEIVGIFNYLRQTQIQSKPFEFYVTIPLLNLKKALFKSSLTKPTSKIQKISESLFYYRTFLILLGFLGCILLFGESTYFKGVSFFFLSFFILLYVALCAGTSPQMRNIEMRYFLHADVLFIIPASFVIMHFYERLKLWVIK